MSEANKAIGRRWFQEVWNEAKDASVHELFLPEGVARGLGESEADVHGPAEFLNFAWNLRRSIRDLHIQIDDEVAEGDRVALRITLTGSYSGEGLGGTAPAGTPIRVQGIVIGRVVDGKLMEAWNSYDQLGLLRQIGALPARSHVDRLLTAAG